MGSAPDHHIRLNVAARADVMWWQLFVSLWNGVSMLCDPKHSPADLQVFSDASGSWGQRAHPCCYGNGLVWEVMEKKGNRVLSGQPSSGAHIEQHPQQGEPPNAPHQVASILCIIIIMISGFGLNTSERERVGEREREGEINMI